MWYRFCLISPLLFLVNALVLGWVTPRYNARTTAISQLVHYKYGFGQTLNFIVCGLLSLGLAYFVSNFSAVSQRDKQLVLLGALTFGLCLVTVGLFRTDYAGQSTLTGKIHNIAFIASVIIQGALQIYFALSRLWHPTGIYFLISGVVTIIGLVFMAQFPSIRGIAQRILVLAIAIWVSTGPLLIRK